MGFKAGSVMTLDNALKMMLIKSANDIAMAVGENVGGSEEAFVERMNAEALRLGMTDTHFANPNGLHSPDQYTTARDLALLVCAIRNEFPQYAPYFAIEGLKAGKKKLMSYNMLVGRYAGADGMKTGFVCASGFNMVGSATRGGRTLVAVVLGETSAVDRTDNVAALLDRRFPGKRAAQGSTLATLPFYGLRGAAPVDMREEVCGKKKPAAAQSEAARRPRGADRQIAMAREMPNPKLVDGRARRRDRPGSAGAARRRRRGICRRADPDAAAGLSAGRQGDGAGRHGRQLGADECPAFRFPSRC